MTPIIAFLFDLNWRCHATLQLMTNKRQSESSAEDV
jgi:hypothetical protein